MNSLERVMATINRQPVDRTPIDCWLYQKQFLEKLEAEYGPREKFMEEFGVDVFVGLMPFPNQYGRRFDIKELADLQLEDPKDPKWLTYSNWNYDFGGTNIATAVAQQKGKRAVLAHCWGMVEGTSSFLGLKTAGCIWAASLTGWRRGLTNTPTGCAFRWIIWSRRGWI